MDCEINQGRIVLLYMCGNPKNQLTTHDVQALAFHSIYKDVLVPNDEDVMLRVIGISFIVQSIPATQKNDPSQILLSQAFDTQRARVSHILVRIAIITSEVLGNTTLQYY